MLSGDAWISDLERTWLEEKLKQMKRGGSLMCFFGGENEFVCFFVPEYFAAPVPNALVTKNDTSTRNLNLNPLRTKG